MQWQGYRFRKFLTLLLRLSCDMSRYHSSCRLSTPPCSNFHRSTDKFPFQTSFLQRIPLRSSRRLRTSTCRIRAFCHFSSHLDTGRLSTFWVGRCLIFYRWPKIRGTRRHWKSCRLLRRVSIHSPSGLRSSRGFYRCCRSFFPIRSFSRASIDLDTLLTHFVEFLS